METGDLYSSNYEKKRNIKSDQVLESSDEAPHDLWDSLDSDTESLLQEKSYQRELHEHILNNDADNSSLYNDISHSMERSEHEERCDDPQPADNETRGGQSTTFSRLLPPWDEYSELRYDPDWRKKLSVSEFLQTKISFDASEDPGDSLRHAGHVSPRKRHKYLVVHSPVLSEMDTVPPKPLLSSFHLHPPEHQDTELSAPESSFTTLESTLRSHPDNTMKFKPRNFHQQSAPGIQAFSSPQQRQHDGENQSIVWEQNKDKPYIVATERRRSHKVRQHNVRDDIVEHNKVTLGMNSHKQGSYLKAYEQRGRKTDDANQISVQPLQSAEDTVSTDGPKSPDNTLNLEQMWIQKTQKLKIHNKSKHMDRDGPHHHRTKPRGHVNQPVVKQHSQNPSPPDFCSVSHCSSASGPTVNLSIKINTPAKLTEPFSNPEPQHQLHTCTLPHYSSSPQWRIRNDEYNSRLQGSNYVCLPLPPAGTVSQENVQVTNENSIRVCPTQPPFHGSFISNASTSQPCSGAYPVLPPIGRSNNIDSERCSGRPKDAMNTIRRSVSEGCLTQLEKQKQVLAKTTYKAYTLKDYKNLNRDVKLGGLGPSNTVAENVAEKIRQQKLYSNLIREQNKKISRIPSGLTRNTVGSKNTNNIPRNKALEYAKTISKPKPPQHQWEKPKEEPENERVFEHLTYLRLGVDLTQLSTLEMLRKRHEQEKQVVAPVDNLENFTRGIEGLANGFGSLACKGSIQYREVYINK